MGKSKKKSGKRKNEVYRGAIDIRPCPFCRSDNIILATDSDTDVVSNMKVLCLGCKTVFVLNMGCTSDNILPALRFWNRRGLDENP